MAQPNRFDSFKFPKYQYREYPKWVKGADGKDRVVQSMKEECEAVGKPYMPSIEEVTEATKTIQSAQGFAPEVPAVKKTVDSQGAVIKPTTQDKFDNPLSRISEKEDMADLMAQAESLGIRIKGNWGAKRLKEEIETVTARINAGETVTDHQSGA